MEATLTPKDPSKKPFNWAEFLLNNAIAIILILLLVVIVIIEPRFLSIVNFRNILAQASTRLIFALGVGGIIIAKGTDLSLGRQVGIAAVISASLLQAVDYAYRMYPDLPKLPIIVPVLAVIAITAAQSSVRRLPLQTCSSSSAPSA